MYTYVQIPYGRKFSLDKYFTKPTYIYLPLHHRNISWNKINNIFTHVVKITIDAYM